MSKSAVDVIVSDYFARLRQALAPLPRSRRNQLLDDLREHVTLARAGLSEESELSVREVLEHLGTPEDIAAEALAGSPRSRGLWRLKPGPLTRRKALGLATAVVVLAAGSTLSAIVADRRRGVQLGHRALPTIRVRQMTRRPGPLGASQFHFPRRSHCGRVISAEPLRARDFICPNEQWFLS